MVDVVKPGETVNISFDTVEIPLVTIGNRRALMGLQIVQMPWLRDFIEQFKDCFEFAPNMDAMFFIERDETIPCQAVEGKGSTEGVETRR